jgi:DNA polymerase II small subunit
MGTENDKELVNVFLDEGILLSPDSLSLNYENYNPKFIGALRSNPQFAILYDILINDNISFSDIDWLDADNLKFLSENNGSPIFDSFIKKLSSSKNKTTNVPSKNLNFSSVNTIFSYDENPKKRTVKDFVNLFNHRYSVISSFLQGRPEMSSIISIKRVSEKNQREEVSFIGMVKNKSISKSGHIFLDLEDQTGLVKCLVNKNNKEFFTLTNNVLCDEVIGVKGSKGDGLVFLNEVFLPDIPLTDLKKAPIEEDVYAIFLSDLHVGSKYFLSDKFKKFLSWISLKSGNKSQKDIASKVSYVFIAGDLVDGVGIYPNQDKELDITDLGEQYNICADYLKDIPSNIKIIIIPGNHDASRIAEPQAKPYKEFAQSLYDLPNTLIVSNPSLINIHSFDGFPGFNVLLYHGYSFDYFINNISEIRLKGGYDRSDLVMKHLLQRRHLAPTFTSTPYVPTNKDHLIISSVPDFFITGHIHKCAVSNYKNVTLISGSCWQSTTSFQEKMGHHPEPARVPIVNLRTREMKILRF